MSQPSAIGVEREPPLLTIKIEPFDVQSAGATDSGYVDIHLAMAESLERARWDDEIRIVIITGKNDGEFYWPPPPGYYADRLDQMNPNNRPPGRWSHERAAIRVPEALALIEKPVIARVNGHASSNGQSIIFGSDLIVAWEDAIITDNHLGMEEVTDADGVPHGYPFGVTPGDGAGALVPLFLPPTKAKEYLFLSPGYTARELARMNIVNYAVPMDQIDTTVEGLVSRLLKRPARTLARTKRAVNKALVNQMNLTGDLMLWSETLDFWEQGRAGWRTDVHFAPETTTVDEKPR